MKKIIVVIVALLIVGSIAAYFTYKHYMPNVVAEAIISEDVPDYLPKRVQNKIKSLRSPVNTGAEDVVKKIHQSEIPLKKILEMIDNTHEDQIDNLLQDLNLTPLKSTDQVFDIAKKHLTADFDIEVLRQPFNKNVNLKMIQKGIQYSNTSSKANNINIETAKAIVKKILIEKEKELSAKGNTEAR